NRYCADCEAGMLPGGQVRPAIRRLLQEGLLRSEGQLNRMRRIEASLKTMPGFTAEAALSPARVSYRILLSRDLPASAGVTPAFTRPRICGSLYGCCSHGIVHCCEKYFDICIPDI